MRARSRAVPRILVTPRPSARERRAEPERTGQAIDENGRARPRIGLAQRRVGGADIAEPRRLFVGHIVGDGDQIVLRRGRVLAHAGIGVGVELFLRVRAEAEIAAEGIVGAIHRFVGAAGRTRAAEQAGIDIDPVAFAEILHQLADLGDLAGDVEAEIGRQPGQRQFREPALPVGEHVHQVRHDVAGLDLDQDVGRPRFWDRHPLKLHRLTGLMQHGGEHGGHVDTPPGLGRGARQAPRGRFSISSLPQERRGAGDKSTGQCRPAHDSYTYRPPGR